MSKSWTDFSDEEFEQVLDNLSDSEYGQLTDAEFFGALSANYNPRLRLRAMDEADEIKLTAHLDEKGQLVFDKPATLPVEGNVIKIGVKRDVRVRNRVSPRNSVS